MTDEFEVDLDVPAALTGAVSAPVDDGRVLRLAGAPPLEVYVASHVAEAMRLVAGGLKDPQQFTDKTPGDDRVSRAEKYARWRWQGYIDGEIASL